MANKSNRNQSLSTGELLSTIAFGVAAVVFGLWFLLKDLYEIPDWVYIVALILCGLSGLSSPIFVSEIWSKEKDSDEEMLYSGLISAAVLSFLAHIGVFMDVSHAGIPALQTTLLLSLIISYLISMLVMGVLLYTLNSNLSKKYGDNSISVNIPGAPFWLWFVPFGFLFAAFTIKLKNGKEDPIIGSLYNFVFGGAIALFISGIITRFAIDYDNLILVVIGGLTFIIANGLFALFIAEVRENVILYNKGLIKDPVDEASVNNSEKTSNAQEYLNKVKELYDMYQKGALTKEEFEALKKKELGL